jgi:hypothetical protein
MNLAAAVVVSLALVPGSHADAFAGPCTAEIDGRDASRATSARPIVVARDAIAGVVGTAPVSATSYEVDLVVSAAPLQRTVRVGSAPARDGSWVEAVDVPRYARYGVGLYRLDARVFEGSTRVCAGTAWIHVAGNPVGTVAGGVGAVLLAAGLAGLVRAPGRRRAAVVGGLAFGAGTGVLLQQSALAPPAAAAVLAVVFGATGWARAR